MYSPIPELNELKDLYDSADSFLAAGFEIYGYNDKGSFIAVDQTEPEFLDRLIPIAQANGSGSEYVIWRVDDREDLAALPIAVFGDEGGEHIIARNFGELLRLLAYDAEIMAMYDEAYFYRQDDDEHSGSHDIFVKWLRERHGLESADDPGAIVKAAQDEFGDRFRTWITPFVGTD
ncbi:hypothetical protein [Fodinicola feengrottensis]